ncbi:hypothetical protein DPMN_186100 [Dreissena polymorpha]|uniref:Uncharacterized protein n=1 Tax=Dreissena polymorpha TaxID=45954 RepID=A0A9D4DLR6_DREPO|nr:hypothetical protein DPMN_186100 [Dreissena polymorpha]
MMRLQKTASFHRRLKRSSLVARALPTIKRVPEKKSKIHRQSPFVVEIRNIVTKKLADIEVS